MVASTLRLSGLTILGNKSLILLAIYSVKSKKLKSEFDKKLKTSSTSPPQKKKKIN